MEADLTIPDIALSIRQPWAWAVAAGFKTIENRGWNALTPGRPIQFRGSFAIHASQGMTRREYEDACTFMEKRGVCAPMPAGLVFGAIIGVAKITGSSRKSTNVWFTGPLGLWIDEAVMLPEPIPCSGALGFFKWEPSRTSALVQPLRWMREYGQPKPAPAQIEAPLEGGQGRML